MRWAETKIRAGQWTAAGSVQAAAVASELVIPAVLGPPGLEGAGMAVWTTAGEAAQQVAAVEARLGPAGAVAQQVPAGAVPGSRAGGARGPVDRAMVPGAEAVLAAPPLIPEVPLRFMIVVPAPNPSTS